MRRRQAALGLVLCSLGCAQPKEPLRIAANPWPGYEVLFMAALRGAYARAGVDVELVNVSSVGDARRSFEREQVDGMATTLVEVLSAWRRSPRRPRIVYAFDYSDGADVVLARPGLENVASLKGRRVGLEPESMDALVITAALATAGLSPRDVALVPVPQNEMPTAFRTGLIDAAPTYPPFSVQVVREGVGHPIFDSSRVPGDIIDLLAFDARVIAERRDDVTRILLALDETLAWMRAHPDSAASLAAAREGIQPGDYTSALRGIRTLRLADQAAFLASGGRVEASLARADSAIAIGGWWSGPLPAGSRVAREPFEATQRGKPR